MAVDKELSFKIDKYLEENRAAVVEDLKRLVRIPSILAPAEEGAPFGKACLDALKAASDMFAAAGCKSGVYGEGSYGLAEFGEGKTTIGVFGHSDVVPVSEGWITTAPFDPIEKDGVLYGRGIEDNKAGVIAGLYLVKMISALNIPVKSKISCFIGAAEETGMQDIDRYVEEQKMPDVSLVPDGNFPVCYGEKGMCRFWAVSAKKLEKIKGFKGGSAFNVVLDDVTVSFDCDDDLYSEIEDKIKGEKDYTLKKDGNGFSLRVKGLSQHASQPEGSMNAAWMAAKLLKDLKGIGENDREVLKTAEYLLDGYYGEHFNISHTDSVFGKLTCTNGMVDITDGMLRYSYDIRCGTENDIDKMLENIKGTLEKFDCKFILHECEKGFLLPRGESRFLPVIEGVYREVSGISDAEGFVMSGGTYCRRLKNAFSIGTCAPYKNSKPEMPAGHGGAHQSDESITVDGLLEAIKLLTLMVVELDKTL